MARSKLLSVLIAVLGVQLCAAQAAGWIEGQVNTTICQWNSPRVGVIRDQVYIDGGYQWWQPGLSDGSYGSPIADDNPLGLVYVLNFSSSFDTSPGQNLTNLFATISKASGGGNANNIGPLYVDGAMFANDYEWITYGGVPLQTAGFADQDENAIASYERYRIGPERQFNPGYVLRELPDGTTRYVSNGAGVSIPSENLGFYFGGLRSPTAGPIYYINGNTSYNAVSLSPTLIKVDMDTTQRNNEQWSNDTLPTSVPGRANAELVWVPIGEKGVLVAIGGVINPSFATVAQKLNASATAQSERTSPGFMKTVSIYDVARQVWYEQETSGDPPQLTQGCTVMASAQDGTSHNIYFYGGYNGIDPKSDFSDDVWILSIPSFMWMKVYAGTPRHGRAGHKCVKPYPDQMFVIGGYTSASGAALTCVEGNIIQIFNLSSAEWITSYNPDVWSNYTVPSMIYTMIGGSGTGSATQTAPSPSGFSSSDMTDLFASPYNTSKITNWFPYASAQATGTDRPTLAPLPHAKSTGGTPSYLAPVLGVVLGLFFITLVVIAILLYRRRKILNMAGTGAQSEAGTMDNRRWVANWLRATPADAKAPTVTTDDTPMSSYGDESPETAEHTSIAEMGDQQVHEMMDTSMPSELHGMGLVPVVNPNNERRSGMAHSASVTSHTSRTSTVSHISDASTGAPPRPGISPVRSTRVDYHDATEGSDTQYRGGRPIVSDLSITETERGHLRGISETSVSTDGAFATPMESLGTTPRQSETAPMNDRTGGARPLAVSPMTPPEGAKEANDYLGSGSPSKEQKRKSNFQEGLEEAEKK